MSVLVSSFGLTSEEAEAGVVALDSATGLTTGSETGVGFGESVEEVEDEAATRFDLDADFVSALSNEFEELADVSFALSDVDLPDTDGLRANGLLTVSSDELPVDAAAAAAATALFSATTSASDFFCG